MSGVMSEYRLSQCTSLLSAARKISLTSEDQILVCRFHYVQHILCDALFIRLGPRPISFAALCMNFAKNGKNVFTFSVF